MREMNTHFEKGKDKNQRHMIVKKMDIRKG